MSKWRQFLRFALTASLLFVFVLAFSFVNLDMNTEAGQQAFVVSVLALVPAVLTIVGVVVVLLVDWEPF